VSESLAYPDFTVVALYKKTVVGCAFMTPSAYITYIAVHPEWRGAGIATFMLYHLIQVWAVRLSSFTVITPMPGRGFAHGY
jgi:ribosomal protein S18 acetylase RimI-like enzyme